jgi:hypothetical protein
LHSTNAARITAEKIVKAIILIMTIQNT